MSTLEEFFTDYSADKLKKYTSRIQDCLGRLTEEQIWMRDSESVNSVGNLVLHLCGNVGQWIGSGVGGRPDHRKRDTEFEARGGVGGGELAERLRTTVEDAIEVIRALTPEQMAEVISVQNYCVSKLEAIYHVVEHFALHAGQIMFATKLLTGQDLGYYKHLSKSAPVPTAPYKTP